MLRLTLRTLLAWLDDTLSPSEVREIGKQVGESPVGKELVERIQRVTRQRRLTVPSSSGAEATDPNLVAAYLDGGLNPDDVADFEKRCLTSDVHLAEVASVHQILSLIGQKAKVPAEARYRMYQLVKGRESVAPKIRRTARVQPEAAEPVSEPVPPWVTPEPPRRPLAERYGPLAAVLALIAVLCWTAWKATTPQPAAAPELLVATLPTPPKANPAPAAAPEARKTEAEATSKPETAAPEPEPNRKDVAMAKPEEPAKEPTPKPNLPAGALGQVSTTNGVVLQYATSTEADTGQWERLAALAPLKGADMRLLNLAPFRTELTLGSAEVEMVGETELWVQSATAAQAARVVLSQGRVLLHGTTPPAPFDVRFAGRLLTITPPPGIVVGLERLNRRERGAAKPLPPILRIYVADGEVPMVAKDVKETLKGPGSIGYDPSQGWTEQSSDPPPSWVSETAPPPFDVQIGQQFLSFFPPDRPVPTSIVEALENDQKEIRQLAISALRAMGEISFVVPLLNKEDSVTRRTAVRVLRAYLAESEAAAAALRAELEILLGKEQVAVAEKLLAGYTDEEAKDPDTYKQLVGYLESKDPNRLGIRELALDNLETLTGRDDLGYDPVKPEGKGLRAWQQLRQDNELRPVGTPKAKK